MRTGNLSLLFGEWIDRALSGELPDGIAAFHFNMYDGPETHDVEIVGCPTYDPNDSDWACDDIFMSAEPRFELPHTVVGEHWESALAAAMQMLGAYMKSDAVGARRMRRSQAVSIGFVDGNLHLVWSGKSA